MNLNRVEEIARVSKMEKWPYPRTFQALKKAGVLYYKVKVPTREIVYYGLSGQFQEPVPQGFEPYALGEFCIDSFRKALKEAQAHKIDYGTFLRKIAEAGIASYQVEMSTNRITYSGIDPENNYQELIPGGS